MIRSRISQLIFRTVFLTISVIGIIESFGLFAGQTPSLNCFLWYTSLSNFLCFGVMVIVFISTLNHIRKGEMLGNNTIICKLKFYSTIAILVTFIIYNFILADNMFEHGWNNIGNLTKHIICPLLFVIDFLIFDKHHSLRWFDPLLCTLLPLMYATFILVRAALLPTGYAGTIYPYFFLDVTELGVGGVSMWVGILVGVFIVISYLFYFYDKLGKKNNSPLLSTANN